MSKTTKPLSTLLKKLKVPGEEPPARDPIAQLVFAFLQWQATSDQAEAAMDRLMEPVVDFNELRVLHHYDMIALLGEDYPLAHQRIARLKETLHEVYHRERATELKALASKGKRDARAYLDTLHGTPPFVAASITLVCFGGHALPVDEKLVSLLAQEGVLDEADTPPHAAENLLLRQLKAGEAITAHYQLQAWADEHEWAAKEAAVTDLAPLGDEPARVPQPDAAPAAEPAAEPEPQAAPATEPKAASGGKKKSTTKKKATQTKKETTKRPTRPARKK